MGWSRWFFANAGLITLVLFVGVPALILHELKPLIASQTGSFDPNSTKGRVVGFCTNYFTTLLMWVINSFWSPYIMNKALEFEHHATKSSLLASQFFKFSLFLLVNLTLLPIFAMTTVADLFFRIQTSGNDETWSVTGRRASCRRERNETARYTRLICCLVLCFYVHLGTRFLVPPSS